MASLTIISRLHPLPINSRMKQSIPQAALLASSSLFPRNPSLNTRPIGNLPSSLSARDITKIPKTAVAAAVDVSAGTADAGKQKKNRYPGEAKGFVEEMRYVAMKLHTREQAKEGEKVAEAPEEQSPAMWEPTVDGYLKFLVDSKLVYDTLEMIVVKAHVPYYAEFRNTGLERSQALTKDLEWFKDQGYTIPEPSEPGLAYASYLHELAEKDPQAFICHFYNIYFAHSAGGRMIGKKVNKDFREDTQ